MSSIYLGNIDFWEWEWWAGGYEYAAASLSCLLSPLDKCGNDIDNATAATVIEGKLFIGHKANPVSVSPICRFLSPTPRRRRADAAPTPPPSMLSGGLGEADIWEMSGQSALWTDLALIRRQGSVTTFYLFSTQSLKFRPILILKDGSLRVTAINILP